jgi:PilZ domain-containing protein
MWSNYLFLLLGGGIALAAVHARRVWTARRKPESVPNPLDISIRDHHLDPGQAATLHSLVSSGPRGDASPVASAEAFDRKAVLRLREVVRRGQDSRAEAERLRALRKVLGFTERSGPDPHLLSSVCLVAPTGEKCDGIVLGVDGDYLVVIARGTPASLRIGARLSVMDVQGAKEQDAKVGDVGGTVVGVEDQGDGRIVRIGFPKEDSQSRRRHFRLVARLQAMARVGADAPFDSATVVDVSRTGVRIQMRPSVTPKKEDPILLQVRVGEEVVETRGRVVWARQALYLAGGEQPWLVGAEFPEFDLEAWARIVERVLAAGPGGAPKPGVQTVSPEAIR